MFDQIKEVADFLQKKGICAPEIGIVLGTGLGKLADSITIEQTISYADIPHFPVSTVESHAGKLLYGKLSGKKVLAMQGRFHYYEGYTMQQITFPIRVMKLLGVKFLLLSNAAGGLNPKFGKGDLMLLDDHINLLPANPLTGKNIDALGVRFPDMSAPYSSYLNQMLKNISSQLGILLHEGVYVSVPGPNLETRAEYRYLRTIGADAVGMSTVPEVIIANHMQLPCAAVSVITDLCDPDYLQPSKLEEILEIAAKGEEKLVKLFNQIISQIN